MIGSLIVISIIFCCARCLCCGLECCCGICSCFNRCCPGPRRSRGSKYADGPSNYGGGYSGYRPPPAQPTYDPSPRFAQFDAHSKNDKLHDDSLPVMPSWDNASTRKVEDHSQDDVEMGRLDSSHLNGAIAPSGRSGRNGYEELSGGANISHGENVANYRGADATNPYDLGTQRYADALPQTAPTPATAGVYGSPPRGHENPYRYQPQERLHEAPKPYQSQDFFQPAPQSYGGLRPQPQSEPSYRSYAPSQSTSTAYEPSTYQPAHHSPSPPPEPESNRPPSLLQAGRKPVGS